MLLRQTKEKYNWWIVYVILPLTFLFTACDDDRRDLRKTGHLTFRIAVHDSVSDSPHRSATIDCSEKNIDTVKVIIYDTEGNELTSNDNDWPCSTGHGEISDVKAGSGRIVVALFKNDSDELIYRGEAPGIDVIAGKTTPVEVVCYPFFDASPQSPNDGSVVIDSEMQFTWNDVTNASEYNLVVSKDENLEGGPIINTVTKDPFYSDSTLLKGQTYYWQIFASDAYGNKGKGSQLRSFTIANGQLVLYTFSEGSSNRINDHSSFGTSLDLIIDDESAVSWIDGGGLDIQNETIIRSIGPADKIISGVKLTNAITIEAWIKPANITQGSETRPARIVSLSLGQFKRDFTLGQKPNMYEVRFRTTDTEAADDNGLPPILTPSGSLTAKLTHVVYTHDESGERMVYLNGELAARGNVGGDLANWEDYQLLLANEEDVSRPWLGEIYRVAIFDYALDQDQVSKHYEAGHSPSNS